MFIYYLFSFAYPVYGRGVAGASSNCHKARGEMHPGHLPSLLKGLFIYYTNPDSIFPHTSKWFQQVVHSLQCQLFSHTFNEL